MKGEQQQLNHVSRDVHHIDQSQHQLDRAFENTSKLSLPELRDLITQVEGRVRVAETTSPADIPIAHHFSKDVYAREMRMPKGAIVVGKIHKHQNLSILSAGEVSVLSQDGVMRIKAPFTFVATPGTKRVIYAHEDAVWTVIHGTSETDLGKIEDQFIAKDYDELEQLSSGGKLCLGS